MKMQVLIEEFGPSGKRGVKRVASTHPTEEDALETAKAIVESGLLELWHRGMSAQTLMKQWSNYGEAVYVLPETDSIPDIEATRFSAMDFARTRAGELAVRGRL